jgi:hypothetical protein
LFIIWYLYDLLKNTVPKLALISLSK